MREPIYSETLTYWTNQCGLQDTGCIFNIATSNILSSFQVKQLELVASSLIYITN